MTSTMWSLSRIAVLASSLVSLSNALGQKQIISFDGGHDTFRLAGRGVGQGQILVSDDDYWGVIRAAGDLAVDFGRVTGTNHTLSNGKRHSDPAQFEFAPVDVSNNTVVRSLVKPV